MARRMNLTHPEVISRRVLYPAESSVFEIKGVLDGVIKINKLPVTVNETPLPDTEIEVWVRPRAIHVVAATVGEDVDGIGGIAPVDSWLTILGASSNYLLVDVTRATGRIQVGDEITFALDYGALLAAMTSPYMEKRSLRGGALVEASV